MHFGAESSTLDLGTDALSVEQLEAAEARANALVWENRAVTVSYEHAAEAAGLRKRPEREGPLRIVSIDGVDRSACGGTHVRSTAEIGPVLVRGVERVRGNARVAFVWRARVAAREDHALLTRLALDFSRGPRRCPPCTGCASGSELRAAWRAEEELAGFAHARLRADEPPRTACGERSSGTPLAASMSSCAPRTLIAPRRPCSSLRWTSRLLLAASEDSVNAGAALRRRWPRRCRGGGSPRRPGQCARPCILEQVIRKLVG